MSPYQGPIGAEAEQEPGSHRLVLRNNPGLKRKTDMDRAEYAALATIPLPARERAVTSAE